MEEMRKLYQANEQWKEEIMSSMDIWKEELKLHFDVSVEYIRDDIKVFGEHLQSHERRITHLEEHTGVAA